MSFPFPMFRLRRSQAGTVFTLLVSLLSAGQAHADCAKPDIAAVMKQAGIDQTYDPAATKVIQSEAGPQAIQWLAVGWWGPEGGFLAALSCDGKLLGITDNGRAILAAPMTIRGLATPVLKTESVVETGISGFRREKVAIFTAKESGIVELWSHELDFMGFQKCEESEHIQYKVDTGKDGQRITVNGVRTLLQGRWHSRDGCIDQQTTITPVQTEEFCWNARTATYGECGRAKAGHGRSR